MRVFLSYASERREAAEPIAYTLRGRNHDVFLDKSDLPPAGSYDLQIEKAVAESDLMVFLVSPESVAEERFTLTELAFARKKWRSARGRVLPVVIAETPIDKIPKYLTTVQMMHPEGNVAAEVGSFVDSLVPVAKPSRIMPLALLVGALSGLLSTTPVPTPPVDALELPSSIDTFVKSVLFAGGPQQAWLAPYVFSLALVLLLVFWDRKSILQSLFVLPIVILAWALAFNLAFALVVTFGQDDIVKGGVLVPSADVCSGDTATDEARLRCEGANEYRQQIEPYISRLSWLVRTVSGMAAGFVGAFVMTIGLGRLSRRLRSLEAVVLITFIGTICGMLLNDRLLVAFDDDFATRLLVVVWQAAVLSAIAWQFTKAPT